MEISFETLETPALTKAQLAELLFDQIGLNKRESKDMIDAFFDLISQKLVDGEDVKISGFGNFQIRTKAARPGRNPRTGESIPRHPGDRCRIKYTSGLSRLWLGADQRQKPPAYTSYF